MAKAILAPQKDISKFYLLTPTADTATPTTATASTQNTSDSFTLGLGPTSCCERLPPLGLADDFDEIAGHATAEPPSSLLRTPMQIPLYST